jgi:hypothetical protein
MISRSSIDPILSFILLTDLLSSLKIEGYLDSAFFFKGGLIPALLPIFGCDTWFMSGGSAFFMKLKL